MTFASLTRASIEAMKNLRSTADFQWYLIPLLAFIVYIYVVEVERKRWDIVIAGIFFFGIELLWEMPNALILHFSDHAALWSTPGDTAYLIFVGLTIKIAMMFAVAGVIFTKVLPEDRKAKVLGVPNRVLYVISFAIFRVFEEVILNRWGVLLWDYRWWNWPNIWLITLAYCVGFGLCALFHDIRSMKQKLLITAGVYAICTEPHFCNSFRGRLEVDSEREVTYARVNGVFRRSGDVGGQRYPRETAPAVLKGRLCGCR